MKLALQRKASKKLVDRKEEVITLVRRASELQPANVAEAVSELKTLEEAADELGIPLTGDEWGERLAIKKKGGGVHFDDELRAVAATASSAPTCSTPRSWHSSSATAARRSSPPSARSTKGSGAALSKNKMLEKCRAARSGQDDWRHLLDSSYRSAIAHGAARRAAAVAKGRRRAAHAAPPPEEFAREVAQKGSPGCAARRS